MSGVKAWAGVAALSLPLSVALAQSESAAPDTEAASSVATASAAGTSATATDSATLLQRLQEQEQRMSILERKLELQEEAAKTAASSTPTIKASPTRLSFQSADNANVVRFRGVLHFDGRRYFDAITSETADTWLLRRVRPTLEGTLNNIIDFRFTPDLAGGRTIILDAYAAARLQPWAVLTAGKFKVPVGLERIQSAADIRFIERAFPTAFVPNRDLGLQLSGDVAGGVLNYSVGYFNGVSDGGSSDANTPTSDAENDTKGDWAARLFLQPFVNSDNFFLRGLGLGVAATYVESTGSATNTPLPGYRTPGQQTFFSYRASTAATSTTAAINNGSYADGERLRVSPQLYYSVGRFGVLGEYVNVSQDVTRTNLAVTRSDTLDNNAWHVQFAWFLSGEDQSFKGFTPGSTFEVGKSGWGALELVARYHELTIDEAAFAGGADSFANPDTSARAARAAGVGINWYLNQNVKLSVNYERTRFEGGALAGADRPDEEALLSRFGVSF